MIIQFVAAFFGALSFSLLFNTSKQQLFYCGLCGGFSWIIYVYSMTIVNSVVLASFLGALGASILAQIFARIKKAPVTVFQIPGIITLVPGAALYRTLYFVIAEDYSKVSYYGMQTFEIASCIAIAMIMISSINKIFFEKEVSN